EGKTPIVARDTLERAVEAIVRSWRDGLKEALAEGPQAGAGSVLFERYEAAFPVDYRDSYPPAAAVADIGAVEKLTAEHPLAVEFHRIHGAEEAAAGLKVFSHARPIPLSERVPGLENMGFRVVDERTYQIQPQGSADVWFHDMTIESASGEAIALDSRRELL